MYDLIVKKRDGGRLSEAEIGWLIREYVKGEIPDYQMAAFLMAVYFRGLDGEETTCLTLEMADSGERVDLSSLPGVVVDKHSTGGVGDTTTLVLAPWVAASGLPVAKMSGRGLGHTGGTVDKLESIPGFRTQLDQEEFLRTVREVGVAVTGQSPNLAPADGKLYALRDVTGTVDSIPLIASSIMSKKLAGGAQAIVLDVKVGAGAFMKDLTSARALAETMVEIGRSVGRSTVAVLTSMDQPLGNAVGNALEVLEAVATLRGEGPADLAELCLELGAHMLVLGGRAEDVLEGRKILQELQRGGQALDTFKRWVAVQGGDPSFVDEGLPLAPERVEVPAPHDGVVSGLNALAVGRAAAALGAGRARKGDPVDHGVGVLLRRKVGDVVEEGEPLAELYCRGGRGLEEARRLLEEAYTIAEEAPSKPGLILEVIR